MDKAKIQEGVKLILEGIGEDIHREGLVETPDRMPECMRNWLQDIQRMPGYI